jgi:hypothetical protein
MTNIYLASSSFDEAVAEPRLGSEDNAGGTREASVGGSGGYGCEGWAARDRRRTTAGGAARVVSAPSRGTAPNR